MKDLPVTCRDIVEGDISCMRNWRHPGLLPKQYVALCVLDPIVSTLLPNIFVLIGLAVWRKTLVFCCSLVFTLLINRAEQKSHFVANKTQRCWRNEPFVFKRRSEDRFEVNMDGGGGDSGFDPCECIYSHEGAMRRLISLVSSSNTFWSQLIIQKILSEQKFCA